ncbi:hypothetical protein, partial [Syntrophomonas wolfei]|uniref:hypothetical protein n=1 Tax=Syntrophomonas wolfei TaxID=863 RepID=UPI0023F21BAB
MRGTAFAKPLYQLMLIYLSKSNLLGCSVLPFIYVFISSLGLRQHYIYTLGFAIFLHYSSSGFFPLFIIDSTAKS